MPCDPDPARAVYTGFHAAVQYSCTLYYLLPLQKSENPPKFPAVKKVCRSAKSSGDHRSYSPSITVTELSPTWTSCHCDGDLHLPSLPPSSPPLLPAAWPVLPVLLMWVSAHRLNTSDSSVTHHTALEYARLRWQCRSKYSRARVESLLSSSARSTVAATDFLLCCLPFPHMTSVKCPDDTKARLHSAHALCARNTAFINPTLNYYYN